VGCKTLAHNKSILAVIVLTTADSEDHDLNENDAEDDMDTDVLVDNGWHGNSAAEVVSDSKASVNAARVCVRCALHKSFSFIGKCIFNLI